jgi:hypothetical protein
LITMKQLLCDCSCSHATDPPTMVVPLNI